MHEHIVLSPDQFEFVRRLVDEHAGMALEPDQEFFAARRLLSVAQHHGWTDIETLLGHLQGQNRRPLVQAVIESLVTHETSFFRDPHYFDELTDHVLPRLIANRASERKLGIWCAACSTGQEPYTVAMILRERFAETLRDWNIELLASDLSATALRQAELGAYSDVDVRRGLSEARLAQHFRHESTGWKIDDRLKKMVRFQQCNLAGDWSQIPRMDLVLIRNVLIYMNTSMRQAILNRLQKTVRADGYLMLGSTESANVSHALVARPQLR